MCKVCDGENGKLCRSYASEHMPLGNIYAPTYNALVYLYIFSVVEVTRCAIL